VACPFVEAVATALPFEDGSFELVLSFNALSWEPDQLTAIREAFRVLKPCGVALIYLHPFSYSVWLSLGDSFWEEIRVDAAACRPYEFSPQKPLGLAGLTVRPVTLHHPSPQHQEGYYLVLRR
jgi:SAM-dependent methyltransferase